MLNPTVRGSREFTTEATSKGLSYPWLSTSIIAVLKPAFEVADAITAKP